MDIYHDHILEHARHPRNAGRLMNPTHQSKAQNALCGDEAEIFLSIKSGVIREVGFEIQGCILSRATLSIISEQAKNKTTGVIAKWNAADIFAFLGFTPTPSRAKCALFGFEALQALVRGGKTK